MGNIDSLAEMNYSSHDPQFVDDEALTEEDLIEYNNELEDAVAFIDDACLCLQRALLINNNYKLDDAMKKLNILMNEIEEEQEDY